MKYYIFKQTPLPKILGLKNGFISFVCTCGALDKVHIKKFNKLTRCRTCTLKSDKLKLQPYEKLKKEEHRLMLFYIFLENGLLNIISGEQNV